MWVVAAFVLLLLLAMVFRQPLADGLWPRTRAQALKTQAAQALAQRRLTADDGSGARELYEAALAIEPDRDDARIGLAGVAQAALAQAREATAHDRFSEAHAALRLANALSVPRADALAVEEALRGREVTRAGIPRLLSRAAQARESGRIAGTPDAALPLYARILSLQPENDTALEGREDVLGAVLQDARAALRDGELGKATAAIAIARTYDPGHVDLPDTEARLNEELDVVRRRAAADVAAGRLDAATRRYRLLGDAGQQVDAQDGLRDIATAYAARAEHLAADFRFADADAALASGRSLIPDLGVLAAAVRHVDRARQAHARLDSQLSPRDRTRRVRRLLAEAEAAEGRGELLLPPGDSAFDKLRAARALAPADPAVTRASARLLPAARDCFEQALRGNDLGRARACFDAWTVVASDDRALNGARRRLAQRWLAVGDERLGAGEVRGAQAALESARRLDSGVPGLDDFDRRVRSALAATR